MQQDIKMIADKGSQRYEEYCQNNEVKPTEMKATYFMAGYIQGAKDHLCDLNPDKVDTMSRNELLNLISDFMMWRKRSEEMNALAEKAIWQCIMQIDMMNQANLRGGVNYETNRIV